MDTVPTFPSVGLKEVTPVSLVVDQNGAVGLAKAGGVAKGWGLCENCFVFKY